MNFESVDSELCIAAKRARMTSKLYAIQKKELEERNQIDLLVKIEQPLANVLANAPQVKRGDELLSEILKREELMSTAVGRGIAIPHVRLSSVTDLVMAVGVCRTPISDFQTVDDKPVNLLIMIAAAYNQHTYYLQTISYFSAKLKSQELRDAIANAATEKEVYELLCA